MSLPTLKKENILPAVNGSRPVNPFLAEAQCGGGTQTGKIINYSKGNWYHRDEKIALGTEFQLDLYNAQKGYTRWVGNEPAERRIVYIRNNERLPNRDELGYNDQSEWEFVDGKARDPWQLQWYLPMTHLGTGELYCWVFGSEGAQETFYNVCGAYGASQERGECSVPIISLQTTQYKNKKYGRIDKPVLKIERWQDMLDLLLPDGE
jgi:hypothetical protein